MRRMPDARLVVENVVAEAAVRVGAPPVDEMLNPPLLKERRGRDVGVVGIVAGHELSVRAHAVPGVREPLPVGAGLGAVLGDREAGELASIGAHFGHPLDCRNRQHGRRVRGARIGDEGVASSSRGRAAFGDAFVVPVVAAIVGIQLPVVSRRVVAAVAIERAVEVVQLGRSRVRHAVDVGIDRAAIDVGVDGDRDRRILRVRRRSVKKEHAERRREVRAGDAAARANIGFHTQNE